MAAVAVAVAVGRRRSDYYYIAAVGWVRVRAGASSCWVVAGGVLAEVHA